MKPAKEKQKKWTLTWYNEVGEGCLTLRRSDHSRPFRVWNGDLGYLLFCQAKLLLGKGSKQKPDCLSCNKYEVQCFLIQNTVFYKKLFKVFSIEEDLVANQLHNNPVSSYMLLYVRLTSRHMNSACLSTSLMDNWSNDIDIVLQSLHALAEVGLIQLIQTPDGECFIDRNPSPHKHVYLTQSKMLIDADHITVDDCLIEQVDVNLYLLNR